MKVAFSFVAFPLNPVAHELGVKSHVKLPASTPWGLDGNPEDLTRKSNATIHFRTFDSPLADDQTGWSFSTETSN
jgi:hypothetical protein